MQKCLVVRGGGGGTLSRAPRNLSLYIPNRANGVFFIIKEAYILIIFFGNKIINLNNF
jgi:hypothetical protein